LRREHGWAPHHCGRRPGDDGCAAIRLDAHGLPHVVERRPRRDLPGAAPLHVGDVTVADCVDRGVREWDVAVELHEGPEADGEVAEGIAVDAAAPRIVGSLLA
jgi:hypothetical protein